MAAIVEIRGLALAFQGDGAARTVLSGLDLVIGRGEFVALVGASGVGKSSLLRIIAGLAAPSAGDVGLLAEPRPQCRPVALVFQEPRLLPWRHVWSNVAFGLEGLGLSRAARHERAETALTLVGLEGLGDRWPYQLSGGQKQRVGLARALAVSPDLLLMDEPFSAVDAITRRKLQDELVRIWQETRTSILFVTHDIDEAVYLADRVAVLGGSPARIAHSYDLSGRGRPRNRGDLASMVTEVERGLSRSHLAAVGT